MTLLLAPILAFKLSPSEVFYGFIVFGISFIFILFYIITLQNTIKQISIENRKISPLLVWLTLIPGFGLLWQLFIIIRLSQSIKSEFRDRDFYKEEKYPGLFLGLIFFLLFCISIFLIPNVSKFAFIGGVLFWILYWIKINKYRHILKWR